MFCPIVSLIAVSCPLFELSITPKVKCFMALDSKGTRVKNAVETQMPQHVLSHSFSYCSKLSIVSAVHYSKSKMFYGSGFERYKS